MTNLTPKKLSRRDAIKILGAAAGASVLANLPSKWSTPELAYGVLPAHAQTSFCFELIIQVVSSTLPGFSWSGPTPDTITSGPLPYDVDYGEAWNCGSGCIFVSFSGTGVVDVTINGKPKFQLTIPTVSSMLVSNTGEYALNGSGTAGDCLWPNF